MSRSFDGVDDILTCGVSGPTKDLSAMSILAWINPVNSGEGNLGVINREEASGVARMRFSLDASVTALRLAFFVAKATTALNYRSNASVTANIWTHVALLFDSTFAAGTLARFYINGFVTGWDVNDDGSGAITGGATNQYIGNNSATSLTFNGKIAHLQKFNRAIHINELAQAIEYPGSIVRGLVDYWPLWGGSPEGDYSINKNHGTVTGAVLSSDNPPINGIYTVPKADVSMAF